MRRAQAAGAVRVDEASSASTFRELDDAFLQTQTKVWLGEVLHLRFDEDILVADLLADGELLFQVSKVIWKRLLKKNREQLKQSKVYIYERISFGRSNGKYMPYSKVDSFLKICQILGLAGIDLFTPSDVVEKRNVRKVCICIRSLSKKSRMMRLNVPDFDIVTYTIAMPNYIVGGIRRSLEQPQYSSSGSSGYSPHANSKELQQLITFSGQDYQHVDAHYDSDEAESRPSVPEPEDSVDEDSFAAMLLQLNDAPKEESEGYGESGHDIHEEKSLAESVGSLNFGVDSDSVDSTSLIHSKKSYSTQSATDQCSRTRTAKCSLSSEESDSISSHLALDGGKNDTESLAPFTVSERIYDEHVNLDHTIEGNGERFADNAKQESANFQKDNGTIGRHCDDFVCDRESVCSSFEEPRHALNGKASDMSSEACSGLTQRHDTGRKLLMVPEDMMNMIEPSTNKGVITGITGLNHDHDEQLHSHDQHSGSTHRPNAEQGPVISETEDDSTSREPKPEFSTMNQVVPPEAHQDTSQSEDKPVKSEDIAQKREDDAPKSGKGVLKSVAGGITLVGAVFFIVHLRRSKETSFTAVVPSLSEKNQRDSRAKNIDEKKAGTVYPGEWLKV